METTIELKHLSETIKPGDGVKSHAGFPYHVVRVSRRTVTVVSDLTSSKKRLSKFVFNSLFFKA